MDGEFELFKPTLDELQQMADDPKDEYIDQESIEEWGLDCAWGCYVYGRSDEPTPLRQNILLFMAAMNGEL